MLENYLKYLKVLDKKIAGFFERQKPYIFCKKGCSKCCKNAQFPYSQIEVVYLLQGALSLDNETVVLVVGNIKKIEKEKEAYNGERFRYNCPFLINNECVVYDYRGIICRSFGLMAFGENGKGIQAPFCFSEGLNYSNVVDDAGEHISIEKFKKLNAKEEPLAFNVSYKYLTDVCFEKEFNFKFGEKKPLIDWLINQMKT